MWVSPKRTEILILREKLESLIYNKVLGYILEVLEILPEPNESLQARHLRFAPVIAAINQRLPKYNWLRAIHTAHEVTVRLPLLFFGSEIPVSRHRFLFDLSTAIRELNEFYDFEQAYLSAWQSLVRYPSITLEAYDSLDDIPSPIALVTDRNREPITKASFHHLSAKLAFDQKTLHYSSQLKDHLPETEIRHFWQKYQSQLHKTDYPIGNIKLFHLGYLNYRMPYAIPNARITYRDLPAPYENLESTWAPNSPCMMCNRYQNTLRHIYSECEISLQLWNYLLPDLPRQNWLDFIFNVNYTNSQLYHLHTYLGITYQLMLSCQRLHVQQEFYESSNWMSQWLQTTFKSFFFRFISTI